MLGVLNTTCLWCKRESVNKYNEPTYSIPLSIPCAIGKDVKYKQTDTGLVKVEELYYILHSAGVGDGDTIDGYTVVVSTIKDLTGQVAYYKAVVVNG